MKIAALCCTYKRPRELAEAVECFLRQDYPAHLRELVVLDDAGQYSPRALAQYPNIKLITTPHRFRTLGEKRNASAALASADVDAYCVWDDDDIYLPGHISAMAERLERFSYCIPNWIYFQANGGLRRIGNKVKYHGAWAFRRAAFLKAGGYPAMQNGEDDGLRERFQNARLRKAGPLPNDAAATYVYRWFSTHSQHISAAGPNGYAQLAAAVAPTVRALHPAWTRDWIALHQQWQRSASAAKIRHLK